MSDSLNIEFRLGEISGKLDAFIKEQHLQREHTAGLELRVSSLERSRAWVIGGAAVAGAFLANVVNFISSGSFLP